MGQYKDLVKDMTFSHSRLTCFEQCPYQFYLSYILRDFELYPRSDNFYGQLGGYVHEILEMIFKGELDIEDASQYYVDHYKEKVVAKEKKNIVQNAYEACADYLCNVDFDWLNDYEILGVEQEVKFEIGGRKFIGYIDLLLRDKRDGKIVVLDHKSSKYPLKQNGEVLKSSEHTFDKYKKQLYLYSYWVNLTYGEFPKELVWNFFKAQKFVTIPFKEDEYDESIKWMLDTIDDIEAEDDFDAHVDDFFCRNLCSFKDSCETSMILKAKAKNAWKYKEK